VSFITADVSFSTPEEELFAVVVGFGVDVDFWVSVVGDPLVPVLVVEVALLLNGF
jgi:hypothetical protein